MAKSGLVILVPEAEPLVGSFRDRHDPGAALGMPAHITLLFPFLPPETIDATVLESLRALFAARRPFDFALRAVSAFPDVVYLPPDPDEPFRELTLAICARYPETPPYGGIYPQIVPHLTVGMVLDPATVDRLVSALTPVAERALPIAARAMEATLVENTSGRWQQQARFALGAA